MESKAKPCDGINKAKGFKGCEKLRHERTHGLCYSCLYDFYTKDERGKIMFAKRKLEVKATNWKEQKKVLKENVKKLSDYEAEAKKAFQKFVRIRDKDLPCISCNNPNSDEWAGGHYFPAGLYSGLMFNERNCHKQCNFNCNKMKSGNLLEYRKGLVNRYGVEFVETLEAEADEKRNHKYTREELIAKKLQYEIKIKELQKNE